MDDYIDRNRLTIKFYWIFAACVFVLEIFDFIYYYNTGYGSDLPLPEYALSYLVLPTAACVLLGLALGIITAYFGNRNPPAVACCSLFMLIVGITVLVIVHYTVSVIFLAYVLPVIVSVFYSSKRITLGCFALSLTSYLLIVFLYLPTRPPGTYKHDFVDMLTTISIIIFFVYIGVKIMSAHRELTAKLVEKTIAQVTLERRVKEDPLTKLYNHAVFYDSLDMAIMSFKDIDICFCLSVLDIDNFKTVNDRYGHVFGDQVILCLVDAIRAHTNENDMAFRYGGEEFAVISFRTLDDTIAMADKIRETFSRSVYNNHPEVRCTVSIGVNAYSCKFNGKREFFASADSALFRAKKTGKNKVVATVPEDYGEDGA